MDTSLNLPATPAAVTAAAPALPRAVTTKVQALEGTDGSATLPADKPFVAQVVAARLSGSEFPETPSEIVPPERTLRPYDVPMLPYDSDAEQLKPTSSDAASAPAVEPQEMIASID